MVRLLLPARTGLLGWFITQRWLAATPLQLPSFRRRANHVGGRKSANADIVNGRLKWGRRVILESKVVLLGRFARYPELLNPLPGGIDLGKPLLSRLTVGDGLLRKRLAAFDNLAILTKLLKSGLCTFDVGPPFLAGEFRRWLLRDCGTYESQSGSRYCHQDVAETLLHHAIHMELPDEQHTRRFIICEQLFKAMLTWLTRTTTTISFEKRWANRCFRVVTAQSLNAALLTSASIDLNMHKVQICGPAGMW